MGSQRRGKVTIWTQRTDIIHRGGQDCCQEQLGIPCSPNNAPLGQEMHPRGSTASAKGRL